MRRGAACGEWGGATSVALAAHVGGPGALAKVSPARSYPGLFRVKESLLSLVFRTKDVWLRCNQVIETSEFLIRVSLLTPTMQAGQDSDG